MLPVKRGTHRSRRRVRTRSSDLSFNNIELIEGLSSLTKLTDLSLYNNAISKIQGLDTLVDLNVLSLGNNKIATSKSQMGKLGVDLKLRSQFSLLSNAE